MILPVLPGTRAARQRLVTPNLVFVLGYYPLFPLESGAQGVNRIKHRFVTTPVPAFEL